MQKVKADKILFWCPSNLFFFSLELQAIRCYDDVWNKKTVPRHTTLRTRLKALTFLLMQSSAEYGGLMTTSSMTRMLCLFQTQGMLLTLFWQVRYISTFFLRLVQSVKQCLDFWCDVKTDICDRLSCHLGASSFQSFDVFRTIVRNVKFIILLHDF